MSPVGRPRPTLLELGERVRDEIERSINLPNLLAYQPQGKQIDFHKSTAIGRYVSGGNQGGKTHALVSEFLWLADDSHPYKQRPERWGHGPISMRLIAVDVQEGVLGILIPKFKQLTPRGMLIDGSWEKSWDEPNLTLTFANGSFVDFLTYKMDLAKFGGVQRHVIGFDEEPPQDIFNESMPRLYKFRGWWIIAATNVKGITWTADYIILPAMEVPKPSTHRNIDVFEINALDNRFLETKVSDRQDYNLAMSEAERKIRDEGKIVALEGHVFPEFNNAPDKPDSHVVPHRWPRPGDRIYTSTDHGVKNATCWLWHAVSPNGEIFTFAEHFMSNLSIKQHAAIVNKMERDWKIMDGGYRWFRSVSIRTGDPAMKQREGTSGMNPIQAYALEGLGIYVDNIPKDVGIGIDKMHDYFRKRDDLNPPRPTWTISENCPNLIRELRKLQWDTYESSRVAYGKNPKEEVKKVDDHAFDSARYFATLMPDLAPHAGALPGDDETVTLSYADMLVHLVDQGYDFKPRLKDYEMSYADRFDEE